MTQPFALDLSHWNGAPDFGAVHASGVEAIIAQSSHGSSGTDSQFARTWALTGPAMRRGAYHFARPDLTGPLGFLSEAHHFVDTVGPPGAADILAVDCEAPGVGQAWGLPPGGPSANWVVGWLSEVEQLTRHVPWLYCSSGFLSGVLRNDARLRAFPLWIANINPGEPATPWPFALHQYTWTARVPGCAAPVDASERGPAYDQAPGPRPGGPGVPDGRKPICLFATPDGGRYLLMEDGGVETLHGVFWGSYPGLKPQYRQSRLPFVSGGARGDGPSRGYTLIDAGRHRYDFGPEPGLQALLAHPTV